MILPEEQVKARLAKARFFCFITGAGMGVASGLKTFRGEGGYYKNIEAEKLASRTGFEIHPEITWEWYNERFLHYLDAQPNAGHYAIREFEHIPGVASVETATQNVDGLQWKAGSHHVYELHGNMRIVKCTGCKYREDMTGKFDIERLYHSCGGKLRPNIVWFGEELPDIPFRLADAAVRSADVVVVAGTSSQVYPAANLVNHRPGHALLIEVNPNPAIKHKANWVFAEGTETGLPKLLQWTLEAKGVLMDILPSPGPALSDFLNNNDTELDPVDFPPQNIEESGN